MTKNFSKSETIDLAKKLARNSAAVNETTTGTLETMDYTAKNTAARVLATAVAGDATNVDPKHLLLFIDEYANMVYNIWSNKLKSLVNDRRFFESACKSLTAEAASNKIKAIAESFNLRGVSIDSSSIRVRRADEEATLYFRFDRQDGDAVVNPDNTDQKVYFYGLRMDISWAGTSRSLAASTVAVKIYQELIDLAAEVEATFAREKVAYVYGLPKAEDVAQ